MVAVSAVFNGTDIVFTIKVMTQVFQSKWSLNQIALHMDTQDKREKSYIRK